MTRDPAIRPGAERPGPSVNALSIDVEDWFQVSAFAPWIDPADWDAIPRRVEANVDLLLQTLSDAGASATFFTLGWIAERHPAMVRRIVAAGHELASHGHAHRRAGEQGPNGFRADLRRARSVLEDIGGTAVIGYRAPSFSIGPQTGWAHAIVAECGHAYSSSVFPVAHDHYGSPDAPRFAWRTPQGLWELPPATVRIASRNYPIAGGGWFRLLPYAVSAWGLRRINRVDREPAIAYLHPWEVDPAQPGLAEASLRARLRHRLNLPRTLPRLRRLLREFRWQRIDRVYADRLAT
jgi:polysaccharide deacetylase family protein (PEP-CTERM system associated)